MSNQDMAREQRSIFESTDPYINAGSEIDASDSEADDTLSFDSDLDPDFLVESDESSAELGPSSKSRSKSTGSSTGKSRPNKRKACPSKSTQSRSKANTSRSNIILSDSDADSESD